MPGKEINVMYFHLDDGNNSPSFDTAFTAAANAAFDGVHRVHLGFYNEQGTDKTPVLASDAGGVYTNHVAAGGYVLVEPCADSGCWYKTNGVPVCSKYVCNGSAGKVARDEVVFVRAAYNCHKAAVYREDAARAVQAASLLDAHDNVIHGP